MLRGTLLLACVAVVGFVLTVAVAWGFAYGNQFNTAYGDSTPDLWDEEGAAVYAWIQRRPGYSTSAFHVHHGDGGRRSRRTFVSEVRRNHTVGLAVSIRSTPPLEYAWYDGACCTSRFDPVRYDVAAGWPLRCLHGCICLDMANARIFTGIHRDEPGWSYRLLPTTPLWPRFITNWGFFSCLMFALVLGVNVGRHRIRLRRGRCPRCRYRLDASPDPGCPECGWGRAGPSS